MTKGYPWAVLFRFSIKPFYLSYTTLYLVYLVNTCDRAKDIGQSGSIKLAHCHGPSPDNHQARRAAGLALDRRNIRSALPSKSRASPRLSLLCAVAAMRRAISIATSSQRLIPFVAFRVECVFAACIFVTSRIAVRCIDGRDCPLSAAPRWRDRGETDPVSTPAPSKVSAISEGVPVAPCSAGRIRQGHRQRPWRHCRNRPLGVVRRGASTLFDKSLLISRCVPPLAMTSMAIPTAFSIFLTACSNR